MMFRPNLTKVFRWIFDFQKCLPLTANLLDPLLAAGSHVSTTAFNQNMLFDFLIRSYLTIIVHHCTVCLY